MPLSISTLLKGINELLFNTTLSQIVTPMVNPRWLLLLLLTALVVSPLVAISIGSAELTLTQVAMALWRGLSDPAAMAISDRIVIELRLPRVLLALICGAGLALSGSVLQSVTRNPLADPYLFGISAGASLGAVVAISFGFAGFSLPLCAFLGSLVAVAVVMVMARDGEIEGLILAGVAISFLLSSLASLVLYFGDSQATQAVLFWSLGSFARASWEILPYPFIAVAVALALVSMFQRHLLALLAGDESAHTQGVAVVPLRLGMLLITALVTASLVAYCGGIGFVGLMVPHIVRMLIGGASRVSLLVTALFGAVMMVWVDLLARQLLPAQELPVGVVTAIMGSLFFIVLLAKRRRP
ncbi:FecCD family ABC transporter permease [Ferrimonas lipolytica]|uniref:Iron ABC transporter permease n=1 Tax=Ferrimonas lipolytica TaxID=2724191 RepID=A0A6H1UIH2_9GAMM|nr:iron ABC transporter permease [Ferrimonas lipolytica]QIZ78834.1 iron ABC transporter permease [Ferrimonas lipolytica]